MTDHQRIEEDNRTVLARGDHASRVAEALLGRTATQPIEAGGRGAVETFDLPDGQGVLRKCRRGGLIGKLVSEGYLLRNRPLAEFEAHMKLFEAGLAVPEPLGVMWERRGLLFRGAVATRKIVAVDLVAWLAASNGVFSPDSAPPRSSPLEGEEDGRALDVLSFDLTLRSVGKLIRSMHDLGVYHADLHAGNILVDGDGGVFLIDFDNAAISDRVTPVQCARNLLRLRRSFFKHDMSLKHFDLILAGYGAITIPSWLDAAYRLKGKASDLLAAS